jgi:NAD(P)-dependent dehydrogenase (short-subunit alcohol dehydrogenase family)
MGKGARTMDEGKKRPVVLVTGASVGIGLALVHALRKTRRYRVVATAHAASLDRLRAAGIDEDECTLLRPLDVTSQEQCRRTIEEVPCIGRESIYSSTMPVFLIAPW